MEQQQLGIRVPAPLHRRLKVAAAASGRSMTDILVEALSSFLDALEADRG